MAKMVEGTAAASRGGYDYQLVETPPDMYLCKICHHLSREPYLSVCCGHTFCKTCIEEPPAPAKLSPALFAGLGIKKLKPAERFHFENITACPMCRTKPFLACPNKQNERAIKSLHIYCTYKEKGCEWQGEVNDIDKHLQNSTGCKFESVSCSNQCGKEFERRHLPDHAQACPQRKVDCQYCSITGEHQFIESEHKETCPKFPLPCPNNCSVIDISREDMENHRNTCPLEDVECPNHCSTVLQRQNLISHVETECPRRESECQYYHIKGEYQFTEGDHKEECPKFPLQCPNACEESSMPREKINEHKEVCPLEMVHCEYNNVGCEAKVMRKDQKLHEKEKMEDHLLLTKSKLDSVNQVNTEAMVKLEAQFDAKISKLEAQLEQKTQFINDMLFNNLFWAKELEVSKTNKWDESPLQIVKLINYTEMIKEGTEWTTNYYFDNPTSYNAAVHVEFHLVPAGRGVGKNIHLSIYICAGKKINKRSSTKSSGNNLRFELKLLNQISDSSHRSVSGSFNLRYISLMKEVYRNDTLISNEAIFNATSTCQYHRNDSVFFLVKFVHI
ncbi:TNF receptor-associated factor 4-like [Dysidea avara]|uniref:TNF receptor-associated factor 4-like n=1 Tax=Dysidea avara TaxID=196820 RepID=UPI00332364A1